VAEEGAAAGGRGETAAGQVVEPAVSMRQRRPRWQNVVFIVTRLLLVGVAFTLIRDRMNW